MMLIHGTFDTALHTAQFESTGITTTAPAAAVGRRAGGCRGKGHVRIGRLLGDGICHVRAACRHERNRGGADGAGSCSPRREIIDRFADVVTLRVQLEPRRSRNLPGAIYLGYHFELAGTGGGRKKGGVGQGFNGITATGASRSSLGDRKRLASNTRWRRCEQSSPYCRSLRTPPRRVRSLPSRWPWPA